MTVYVVNVEGGLTKIGMSTRGAISRVKQIQTYHWNRVSICAEFDGGEREEMLMHRRFEGHHVIGEWFDLPQSELLSLHASMTLEAQEFVRSDDRSAYGNFVARTREGRPVGRGLRSARVEYKPPWWLAGAEPPTRRCMPQRSASTISQFDTTPVRARRGPKPTGCLEKSANGWVARIRLYDGSRVRVPVPAGYDEETARAFVAEVQKREVETGYLFALGAPRAP